MEVDRMQKGDFFNLDSAVPIPLSMTKKLLNILSAESTLMSIETDNNHHFVAKLHLLANPIEYYKEMNKIIGKAYKISRDLTKYRKYKENSRVFNSVNIIQTNGMYFIDLQYRSAQGFIDILNNHKTV
ncbi:hypothetical protein [Petroclostridium xylanilyticum]|jgi:hypothetical protein|uniref:hypothetical protein n=1 Tax=Petroclostridium xylanilyticum TaxID=1792311 RepID=UPI000B9939C9|nr:hypothetical protein [Petroclostridium xylanilyticum]